MNYQYFAIVVCYLLCSIPFGILVCKLLSLNDPRFVGSGNIGATNVFRQNKFAGFLTMILDALKGYISLVWASKYLDQHMILFAAFICVFGHIFPIYAIIKLKTGGKGIATLLGVCIFLDYISVLCAVLSWLTVLTLSKISSISSISGLITFIFAYLYRDFSFENCIFCLAILLLVIFSHRSNIKNIIHRKEKKIL